MTTIKHFIDTHFLHFNAAALKDAAIGFEGQIKQNNKMLVSLAGAMSTAELGKSLAEMIRQDKVHAISCTGANLEEDIFNLVAHNHYKRIPHYRDLSPDDEQDLLNKHLNRVTDTCIPEEQALRKIETIMHGLWQQAFERKERYLPHEYFYQALEQGLFQRESQIDLKDSWLIAAFEKNLPIFVPGWEDSTVGNMFAASCLRQDYASSIMKSGIEYMMSLATWYQETSKSQGVGFFQIGGGIAGDFPICVVPMLEQDMNISTPLWTYFCQISDSTTSYGSYSGAVPNEKITWGKLAVDTPKFVIESDATIVAPLVFAYILGW